jgi:thioesterase domain-containing protein/NAD(P)-dependent dehydrogenase (short-subunit alcohol dehydrogenase family)/acyl carrier protein
LVREHDARVLAVGRSEARSTRERLAALADARDRVLYATADAADAAQLGAAVRAAEATWGRSLDGVFHLAATFRACALLEETPASMAAALRAKVAGATVVHGLVAERPGAFVVHFSSVLGAFGGAFAGSYAAANAFLGALTRHQRALGMRSHCLHWSTWRDTGLGRGTGFDESFQGRGYKPIERQDALALLWQAMACNRPELVIGLDAGNVHIAGLLTAAAASARAEPRRVSQPQTRTQATLLRIWIELLATSEIGVDDNFFALGGDSLMAVRVVAQIEAVLGANLPVTALFRAPTIRQLAQVLDQEGRDPACHAVSLRERGARPPLFCVPGAGESATVFAGLAAALRSDRAIHALELPSLDGMPGTSIETIGRGLADAMRRIQPRGPYALAGHCLGGLLAYEAAQQLRARGEEVRPLVLLETLVSDALPLFVAAPVRLRLEQHRRSMTGRSAWDKLRYVARTLAARPEALVTRRQLRRALAPIEDLHRRYVLRPFDGYLTLVFASDSFLDRAPARDPRSRWSGLGLRGTEIVRVAGDHETLLQPRFVSDLAARLDRILDPPAGASRDVRPA